MRTASDPPSNPRLISIIGIFPWRAGSPGSRVWTDWFGGSGRGGTAQMMEKLEFRPPKAHATAADAAEAAGGALLVAGLLTPVASTVLSSVMITAIRKVHGKNGPWNADGGYEYNRSPPSPLAHPRKPEPRRACGAGCAKVILT